MNTMDIVILILSAATVPILINIVLLVIFFKAKGRKKRAMTNVTRRMIETKDAQLNLMKAYLEKLGYDDGAVSEHANNLSQTRISTLTNLLEGVFYEDENKLGEICDDMNEYVSNIVAFDVLATSAADEDGETPEDLKAAVEELKGDNKRLKKEVHKTLKTLNNIFSEYSSMFGEEIDAGDMSAEEILEAMASFSQKVQNEEEPTGDVVVDSEAPEEEKSAEDLADEMLNEANETNESSEEVEEATWEDAFAESGDETEFSSDAATEVEEEPSWDDAFDEEEKKTD